MQNWHICGIHISLAQLGNLDARDFYACSNRGILGYMLSSVRRRVLDVNDESMLVNAVKNIDEAYKETIKSARESWQSNMNSLGADVMPPTTSIDIEDYSDYKK